MACLGTANYGGSQILLTRNLHEVFGENDPVRRRAAINEVFTEDCVFYDPSGGVYRGCDEIDRIAGASNGCRPGEAPAYARTDFVITRDGKIAAVYLFFDKLP